MYYVLCSGQLNGREAWKAIYSRAWRLPNPFGALQKLQASGAQLSNSHLSLILVLCLFT